MSNPMPSWIPWDDSSDALSTSPSMALGDCVPCAQNSHMINIGQSMMKNSPI